MDTPNIAYRRESAMRFCVFEVVDPRDDTRIWVGAGYYRRWRHNALACFSDRKAESFAAIRAAGYEPEPRILKRCRLLRAAMEAKAVMCIEIGQAFRGAKLPEKYRRAYLARHRSAA